MSVKLRKDLPVSAIIYFINMSFKREAAKLFSIVINSFIIFLFYYFEAE